MTSLDQYTNLAMIEKIDRGQAVDIRRFRIRFPTDGKHQYYLVPLGLVNRISITDVLPCDREYFAWIQQIFECRASARYYATTNATISPHLNQPNDWFLVWRKPPG